MRHSDGNRFWACLTGRVRPRRRGEPRVCRLVIIDITACRRAEAALAERERDLRQENARLKLELSERTARFREAVALLETEAERGRRVGTELALAHAELQFRAVQVRALAGEVTTAEHRERTRLSQILHDHLQQMLASAKLRARHLETADPAAARGAAAEIVEVLTESMELCRSLSAELCPPVLREGGLQAALEWLAHSMRERHDIEVALAMPRDVLLLPEDVRIILFQAVRECLFNARKHANVLRARVHIERMGGCWLQVVVSDEGAGFDPARLWQVGNADCGCGLFSIRERIGFIGGRFEIDSMPGAGCRLTLAVPIEQGPVVAAGAVPAILPGAPQLPRVQGIGRRLGSEVGVPGPGHAGDGPDEIALPLGLGVDCMPLDRPDTPGCAGAHWEANE